MAIDNYYVAPAGDVSGGLAGLGTVLQHAMQQREERAAEEEARKTQADAQTALLDAWRSGDPSRMMEASIAHPSISAQAAQGLGLLQDFQRNEATQFATEVLANPQRAGELAERRIQLLNLQGRNSADTQRFYDTYLQDPEAAIKGLQMNFAALNPEAYRAYQEAQAQPEGFSLSDGQVRYDASGNVIAENPAEIESGTRTAATDMGRLKQDLDAGLITQAQYEAGLEQLNTSEADDPTAAQSLAAGYAQRTLEAGETLNTIGPQFTGLSSRAVGIVPQGLRSDDRQLFDQATRNFINASLRRESGAAIAESEFENARLQYIPQPGDSEAVLTQKQRNREAVAASLSAEAGPALETLRSFLPKTTVTIMGRPYQVGSEVTNAQGQRGRIEADGTITVLE